MISSANNVAPEHAVILDEATLAEQLRERQSRPWWRRPSPWWQVCLFPISMIGIGCTLPAKLELINIVACTRLYPNGTPAGSSSCSVNPKVQAAAASFLTITMVLGGIICCITAPLWGSLSDRRGRMFVQRLYAFGPFVTDVIYLIVYFFHERLPAIGRGIFLAAIVDGLFAVDTYTASQAYIADVSEPDSRSGWYALFQGTLYIGHAVGPLISSTIAYFTGGKVFVVFIVALDIHLLFLAAAWGIIPESLLPAQMKVAQTKHHAEITESRRGDTGLLGKAKAAILSALEPLGILLPSSFSLGTTPQNLERKSWHLALVGLAFFPDALVSGAGLFYVQYGVGVYEWTTEEMGLVLSINSVSKVAFLTVVLPYFIKVLRPASGPLLSRDASPSRIDSDTESTPLIFSSTSRERAALHDRGVKWDIDLARVSLVLQFIAIGIMSFATSSKVFIFGVVIVCFGTAYAPTLQGTALEFYRRRGGTEAGSLFGAMNVLRVLGMLIFGPIIFGVTYAKSVETIPKFIFFLGTCLVACSMAVMVFVRIPQDQSKELSTGTAADEGSLIA